MSDHFENIYFSNEHPPLKCATHDHCVLFTFASLFLTMKPFFKSCQIQNVVNGHIIYLFFCFEFFVK